MKRAGILNSDLAGRTARLGHTQRIAIVDCGLPLPSNLPVVDLALVAGIPTFLQVFDVLLGELVVEGHLIADEASAYPAQQWFDERATSLGKREVVSHEDFKSAVSSCVFAVRTGEASPYANIILQCGVAF